MQRTDTDLCACVRERARVCVRSLGDVRPLYILNSDVEDSSKIKIHTNNEVPS